MKNHPITRVLTGLLLLLTAFSMNAAADEDELAPKLPTARGEQCVEPADIMRRNHADFMRHTRDKTTRLGIRSSKHSLVACINCHVLPDDNNDYVSHESDEHFCSSCHAFAAVQIDCFECHADKPASPADPQTHEKISSWVPKQPSIHSVIDSSLYQTQVARESYE